MWMRRHRIGLVIVLLLTALARVGLVFALRTDRGDPGAYEHAEIARAIVEGRGFVFAFFSAQPEPSSQQAPAIPLLLAGAYKFFGVAEPRAFLAIQLVNVLLAVATSAALVWLGTAMWRPAVGLAAGLVAALYPPLIYMVTRVQVANWSVTVFVLTMAAALALAHAWTWQRGTLLGITGALGMLGEPILAIPLAVACLALAWIALHTPNRSAAVLAIGSATLVCFLVLLPWTMRNYLVHGRLLLVKSTFWYVLWQGNHLQATGTDKLNISPELVDKLAWRIGFGGLEAELAAVRQQAESVDSHLMPDELQELASLPHEMARVAWFKARIVPVLRKHPGHYLRMCAIRLWHLLWFDSTNPRALVLPYRAAWLALMATFFSGCALAWRDRPRLAIAPLTMVLALVLTHMLVIMSARFRLPLEAALTLPAGLVLASLVRTALPTRLIRDRLTGQA